MIRRILRHLASLPLCVLSFGLLGCAVIVPPCHAQGRQRALALTVRRGIGQRQPISKNWVSSSSMPQNNALGAPTPRACAEAQAC